MSTDDIRQRFRDLHREGHFIIPNPWDVGSARILAAQGFAALATTSSGFAATLGKKDQHVTLDELVDHTAAITAAVDIPLSVDAEYCFAEDTAGVATTVERLAAAGAAGLSIEDFDPQARQILPVDHATERVAVAAAAAAGHGMVLTARAEGLLYGTDDLDSIVARLQSYRAAGAEAVFAPGLRDLDSIGRVVAEVEAPLNVLLFPDGPSVPEMAAAGVHRMSLGGWLAFSAYGALAAAAGELQKDGTASFAVDRATRQAIVDAFPD